MPIPKQNSEEKQYEKVKLDDWIAGIIEEVQYEEEHQFKGQFARTGEAVRFKFKLDGYEHPHYSRWMSFSYDERANLFKDYIAHLVHGALPFMDFNTDLMKGMAVKTMWTEKTIADKTYQFIDRVRPNGKTLLYQEVKKDPEPLDDIPLNIPEDEAPESTEGVPF